MAVEAALAGAPTRLAPVKVIVLARTKPPPGISRVGAPLLPFLHPSMG
ncbi:hypothetical protein [Caudoviricetes sp.]|nr:hypothetical protein [Caudoviricetes sp.]